MRPQFCKFYPSLTFLNAISISEDCKKLKWAYTSTTPTLPTVHGTSLTLNCPEGFTNIGGDTATCKDGQVVQTDQPPDCRGLSNIYIPTLFDSTANKVISYLITPNMTKVIIPSAVSPSNPPPAPYPLPVSSLQHRIQ